MTEREKTPLTPDLVETLVKDRSPDARARAAREVAHNYDASLSPRERAIAEDIFRAMVKDAEVSVRAALSESLKASPDVPKEIALSLAQDLDISVAAPILEFSSVLSDEDLIDIVAEHPASHQEVIARRTTISEAVSDSLIEHGDENVIATLVKNNGAHISVNAYGRILDTYGNNQQIQRNMVGRQSLPVTIAERLVTLVSEELRERLVTKHELAADTASDLITEAREKATMKLLDGGSSKSDVLTLVKQLSENGRLTPSIIVRAACMGDMDFLEAALAERCKIPVANAYKLVHDQGPLGLKRIIEAAGLPADCYPVLKVAVSVAEENEYDGLTGDRERFVESAIERVLTSFEDDVDNENLEYLLNRLQRYSGAPDGGPTNS